MIYDGLPYNPLQGQCQGHRGPKVVKMADFEVCFLCWHACYQKTNGELWYFKTISKFYSDRFLIFILIQCHITCKLMRSRLAVPYEAYLLCWS